MDFVELAAEKKLIAHFQDYLDVKKPTRKSSTHNNYALRLNGLCKALSITDIEGFTDYDKITDHLNTKPHTTRANVLTAVMDILDCEDRKKHNDVYMRYKKTRDVSTSIYLDKHDKTALTQNQKNNSITYAELLQYYKMIKGIVKEREFETQIIAYNDNTDSDPAIDYLNIRLLLRLYMLHPSRNEYADLVMIPVKEFEKIQYPMKNYLVYTERRPSFLSINIYKTMDKYGEKRIPISDTELLRWIRFHKRKFGYQEKMFYLQNGTAYTPLKMAQQLTKYSKKHIGKSISSTMMYKIVIQELQKKYKDALSNEDLEDIAKYEADLKTFAATRGHSFAIQQKIYADN